jgi:Tol biopolymer transport system component
VRISPDRQYVAFSRLDRGSDIWLAYVRHEGTVRLTFNEGYAFTPVFSPDGNRIAYTSERNGGSAILIRAANGTGTPEMLLSTRTEVHAASWAPNGKWLACIVGEPGRWDIDLLPVVHGSKLVPLVNTPFDEYQPQFSPDGRWVAYTSNDSGRYEIYIVNAPLATGGSGRVQGRWQISTTGGQQPRWRADGKELFFISQQGEMMSVKIDSTVNGVQASVPQPLFPTGLVPIGPTYLYDVSADGRRFVLLKPLSGVAPPLRVIVNWASAFGVR